MIVGKNKSGSGKHYLTYRCDNPDCNRSTKSVRAKYILESLYETLDKLKFTEKEYNAYSKKLDDITEEKLDEIRAEINILNGVRANKTRQITDIARDMRKFEKDSKAYEVAE